MRASRKDGFLSSDQISELIMTQADNHVYDMPQQWGFQGGFTGSVTPKSNQRRD